jgi:hypothetical protein
VVSLVVAAVFALAGCPKDASLGSVTFVRAGSVHRVSLADCVDRVLGSAPKPRPQPIVSTDGRLVATVRSSGTGRTAKQTIWIADRRSGRSRPVFSETQYYKTIGPGDTPGPIVLLGLSGDDRWVFFTIDPGGSGSIMADGLVLRVVSTAGGAVHKLGVTLAYTDYLAWCGGRLVFTGGGYREAARNKRLLVASPPDWRPRAPWSAPGRAFGSVACAPDGRSVAVLSQPASDDPGFFSTRWQLWRVGLDGSHALLDQPPAGSADESPRWSHDGRSILFVRERRGVGTLMLWRDGAVAGPVASLGYSLGYYGHHDWEFAWRT